jgi:hypothetical protein
VLELTKHISPDCDRGEKIGYMVETFFRRIDEKVYYETLFTKAC